jgi:hypothetical protein
MQLLGFAVLAIAYSKDSGLLGDVNLPGRPLGYLALSGVLSKPSEAGSP